ncbi:MAG: hypothetical protein DI536_31240 [Archangium gephyra]|uniref:TIGR02265 family protein n=1 Tax=Archangium gephyra TaxID=48 RepID=A0A2W5UAG4_9BACT|nr:MAG: hypothetical protein DI536_31240 [Archangium gephyra]
MSSNIPTLQVAPGVQLAPVDFTKKSGVNLKGFSLEALCNVASERFGADIVENWKKLVGVDLRVVTATAWFPLEYYYHLIEYVVAQRLEGDARAASHIGAMTAKKEINAFFRFVLGFTTPTMVLGISSRFWRSYYDKTELTVVTSTGNSVHAEVRDWPVMSEAVAYELAGALSAWMEASRARNVTITRLEYVANGVLRVDAKW